MSSSPGAGALPVLQQATATIPMVAAYSTDPVGNGLVASLAHPGATPDWFSSSDDTSPKQLELLITVAPGTSRVGLLGNPNSPTYSAVFNGAQNAGRKVNLSVVPVEARNPEEIKNAFAMLTKERRVTSDATFFRHRQRIADLALESRLPTIFSLRDYAEAGGLMSYGEDLADFFHRAATFVDKIFKGANPGNLPMEQPTLFKLVINRKTADALSLSVAVLHLLASAIGRYCCKSILGGLSEQY